MGKFLFSLAFATALLAVASSEASAKLSERARLVTVAPTLSPMPNGNP
jgi:hypothetical protein